MLQRQLIQLAELVYSSEKLYLCRNVFSSCQMVISEDVGRLDDIVTGCFVHWVHGMGNSIVQLMSTPLAAILDASSRCKLQPRCAVEFLS